MVIYHEMLGISDIQKIRVLEHRGCVSNNWGYFFSYMLYDLKWFYYECKPLVKENQYFKVGHSSNFLYQGFAEKYFFGIYLHSKA